jgi:alpha-tubulin suppressor-like RCC1 family protein
MLKLSEKMQRYIKKGFALPTVMIASVVMLMVLLLALQGVSSVDVAMNAQHYNSIALEAAYSGATYAKKCLANNDYVANWSDTRPLMPNTDCSGKATAVCSQLIDENCSLYVDSDNNLRTTFYASYPTYNTSGKITGMVVTGLVQLLRKSDNTVWDQYSQNVKISIGGIYEPSWLQISSGGNHTCAISSDNNAYCWGNNSNGQLGNNSTNTSTVPVQVDTTGVLSGKTIKQISSGGNHTCAISSDNNAYCWGNNSNGQLGNNSTNTSTVPVQVDTTGVLSGKTIKQISSGGNHTCAISSDNNAYCWGLNSYGQLGNGTTSSSSVPVAVTQSGALSGLNVVDIESGSYDNTCAIASDNNAYCWGFNDSDGELGNNNTASSANPTAVYKSGVLAGLYIKSISVGYYHTCAIASDNNAYCWGYNSNGQLGNGSTTHALQPVAVDNTDNLSDLTIKDISVGNYHTCAIASDNNAYCWGYNSSGQLGNQQTSISTSPVAVYRGGSLSSKSILQISSGGYHTCAIASDNNAYCWGLNSYGQLGSNNNNSSSEVVVIDSSYQTISPHLYTY